MAASNEWYYRVMGDEFGPVTGDSLKSLAGVGTIERDTLVRRGDRGDWAMADRVNGLFAAQPDDVPASPVEAATSSRSPVSPVAVATRPAATSNNSPPALSAKPATASPSGTPSGGTKLAIVTAVSTAIIAAVSVIALFTILAGFRPSYKHALELLNSEIVVLDRLDHKAQVIAQYYKDKVEDAVKSEGSRIGRVDTSTLTEKMGLPSNIRNDDAKYAEACEIIDAEAMERKSSIQAETKQRLTAIENEYTPILNVLNEQVDDQEVIVNEAQKLRDSLKKRLPSD